MYGVSSNFLTAIQQPGRVFKSQATVVKTDYTTLNLTDTQIMSIKHNADSISGDDFEIGSTCAAGLDMEIGNFDNSYSSAQFQGATVAVSIGVLLADNVTVEYCPLGVFFVDSVSRTNTTIKLVCYDAMLMLEAAYTSSLTYPATLFQIAQDIAGKAGLTLATTTFTNYSFSVTTAPSLTGITLRAALSWVAEAAAGFARINRSGQLEIVGYATSSTTITKSNYISLTHDDISRTAITKVAIRKSSSDTGVSSGTASSIYYITGNPLLANNPSGALTSIFNVLNGFTYMPFQSKWQGNPACMAGDKISITDYNGNTYSTILTESEIEYSGGLCGNAAAKALTAQGQSYMTATAVSNSIALVQSAAVAAQTSAYSAASAAGTAQATANSAASAASTAQTTANSASSAASAAQTTANVAQTSANGKNTVYRQSTQPSGGTYKANDIWFDTSNGNRMSVYSGSAWSTAQLGYQAISSIDAGTITTGKLSATYIDVTNLYAQRISTSATNYYGTMGKFTSGSISSEGMTICNSIGTTAFSIGCTPVINGSNTSYASRLASPCTMTLLSGGQSGAGTATIQLTAGPFSTTGSVLLSCADASSNGSSILLQPTYVIFALSGTNYYVSGSSGNRWTIIPTVGGDGVMEVGQYIDFHESATDTSDKSSRLYSSGGVVTSDGDFNCKSQIHASGSTYPQIIGDGTTLQLANSSASSAGVVIQGGSFKPATDNQLNLGGSTKRWATVYAITSTINTSDRNEKNSITPLDADKATSFIAALNPVSYKYNSGTSDRTHYGMISQDVEDEMTALGMTSADFAGFIKSPKTDEDGNDVSAERGYIYGLRYEEFISPLIKTVQGLLTRCVVLEKKIKKLQAAKTAG